MLPHLFDGPNPDWTPARTDNKSHETENIRPWVHVDYAAQTNE